MSKFGSKHTCWNCQKKFYDLGRPSPKCPGCGESPRSHDELIELAQNEAPDDEDAGIEAEDLLDARDANFDPTNETDDAVIDDGDPLPSDESAAPGDEDDAEADEAI